MATVPYGYGQPPSGPGHGYGQPPAGPGAPGRPPVEEAGHVLSVPVQIIIAAAYPLSRILFARLALRGDVKKR